MQRRMQERLVGAIILVALVVLVVPELLSGSRRPSPPRAIGTAASAAVSPRAAMRTVTVDVGSGPTAVAGVAPSRVSAAASPAPVAAPATTASPPPAPAAGTPPSRRTATAARPATVTRSATVTRTVRATPAATPSRPSPERRPASSSGDRWTIQIGSFADRANALRLARRWKARGYAAYVSSAGRGARALHRVRMGAFSNRDAALAFARKLRSQGQRASVVPPGH